MADQMTNVQLYLSIGVPILFNAGLIGILIMYMNSRLDAIEKRVDRVDIDMRELRADIKLLTGKVYEMMGDKN